MAARSSTRSRIASTRPSRGYGCWRSRHPRSFAPSTCWPGRRSCSGRPFSERREQLAELIAAAPGRAKKRSGSVELTPLIRSSAKAEPLLLSGEGVIAKQLDAPYRPGERKGMVKVKRMRTIDCVIVGWRPGKEEGTVGSLILGLYDEGSFAPIGHTSGLKAKEKRELVKTLKPYETARRARGDPSRWDARPGAGVELAPPGAGGRGHLRPRQRRPHPPRLEDRALARRQEAERVHLRPAGSERRSRATDHRRGGAKDVGPDVDLPGRGDQQHRDRDRDGDEGGGEELVPFVACGRRSSRPRAGGRRRSARGARGGRR